MMAYRDMPAGREEEPTRDMNEARRAAREDGVVVIGAGQAGGRAVESLRQSGFAGAITLIGDEPDKPYERPSLSKEMLLDASRETIAWLHDDDFYAPGNLDFRRGVSAVDIDRKTQRVRLSDGASIAYGALILATGARPRQLPFPNAEACYLRTLEDSRRLRARLSSAAGVVIVGAGFIGLEVAAAATHRGCKATVVEAADAPLGRLVPREVGAFYQRLHGRHGVEFRFETQAAGAGVRDGRRFLQTGGGEELGYDVLVVGIGVIPNADLAAAAGLPVDRGVLVDEYGMTADPLIFAVGDVAKQFNRRLGRHIMLESWQNAQNQAIAVAKNIGGEGAPAPYNATPWFWSDQYGSNLQIYGIAEPGGEVIMRGSFDDRSWILFQTVNGRIASMVGLNAARDLRAGRDLIGGELPRLALANREIPLADLARQVRRQPVPLS